MKAASEEGAHRLEFALVRIDDRLVHGQVRLNWVRHLRPRHIVIVDSSYARDAMLSEALQMLAPRDVAVSVLTPDVFAKSLVEFPADWEIDRTMVLLRDPQQASELYAAGVHYASLNLGCLGAAAGRQRISSQVALSPGERATLADMVDLGVRITLQALPTDRAVALSPRVLGAKGSGPSATAPGTKGSGPSATAPGIKGSSPSLPEREGAA